MDKVKSLIDSGKLTKQQLEEYRQRKKQRRTPPPPPEIPPSPSHLPNVSVVVPKVSPPSPKVEPVREIQPHTIHVTPEEEIEPTPIIRDGVFRATRFDMNSQDDFLQVFDRVVPFNSSNDLLTFACNS